MDILLKIKRLIMAHRFYFSMKAREEMEVDGLEESEVMEAIVTARRIAKTLHSTSRLRWEAEETLYIIKGRSLNNTLIYTKGCVRRDVSGIEVYYFFVSSKRLR